MIFKEEDEGGRQMMRMTELYKAIWQRWNFGVNQVEP